MTSPLPTTPATLPATTRLGAVHVTVSDLTLKNGRADSSNGYYGGNASNKGTAIFDHVWLTRGQAGSGGQG